MQRLDIDQLELARQTGTTVFLTPECADFLKGGLRKNEPAVILLAKKRDELHHTIFCTALSNIFSIRFQVQGELTQRGVLIYEDGTRFVLSGRKHMFYLPDWISLEDVTALGGATGCTCTGGPYKLVPLGIGGNCQAIKVCLACKKEML